MNNVKGMLSVVMPAYNEEACIYKNLLETCDCVSTFCPTYEIILVNDGSPDHTFDEAMRARAVNPHIKVATYQVNRGKGGAIKEGISRAKGEYIAFLDADLDLSPMHLQAFLEELLNEDADIVIGSKLHKDSQLIYPLKRKIMSYGYYLLLHILFHLDLKDTQTGVKLFRAAVIKPIAESLSTSGYAFDIEILARANQMGCRILEMPIHLEYRRGMENGTARIRIGDVFSMFFDTLRIFRDIHFRS